MRRRLAAIVAAVAEASPPGEADVGSLRLLHAMHAPAPLPPPHRATREHEFQADEAAISLLWETRYDWRALRTYVARGAAPAATPSGPGVATPAERVAHMDRVLTAYPLFEPRRGVLEARAARFAAAMRAPP